MVQPLMVTCTTAPTGAAAGQTVIDEPASEPVVDSHPLRAVEAVDPAEGHAVVGAAAFACACEVDAPLVDSLDEPAATGALEWAPADGLEVANGWPAPRAAGAAWAWVPHAAALSSPAEMAEAATTRWAREPGMRALTMIEFSPTYI